MIYTSRFSNPELKTGKYTAIRISVGSPRWNIGYQIAGAISELMPKGIYGKYDNARPRMRQHTVVGWITSASSIFASCLQLASSPTRTSCSCATRTSERVRATGATGRCLPSGGSRKTGEVIPELPDPSTPKISKAKMKAAVEQTTLF